MKILSIISTCVLIFTLGHPTLAYSLSEYEYVRVGENPDVSCAIDFKSDSPGQNIRCWNNNGSGFLCIPRGCVGITNISDRYRSPSESANPANIDVKRNSIWAECSVGEYAAVCFVGEYAASVDKFEAAVTDPRNNTTNY